MPKKIELTQTGWQVTGEVLVNTWMGGQTTIAMDETFIPIDKMTKDSLLRCVNDGRFGCDSIETAHLHIYDVYEHGFLMFNREIVIDRPDPSLCHLGI